MTIERLNNNAIILANDMLEGCNDLIRGELDALIRVKRKFFFLSFWVNKERERIKDFRDDLDRLYILEYNREYDTITFDKKPITTREEYRHFLAEYEKIIKSYEVYKAYSDLKRKVDLLLDYLESAQ